MNHISVAELAGEPGLAVVDVREPFEFAAGHVPGAVNVPLGALEGRLSELPAGRPLAVICQSGGRSARAVQLLGSAGVEALNVIGGTAAWAADGRTLEA